MNDGKIGYTYHFCTYLVPQPSHEENLQRKEKGKEKEGGIELVYIKIVSNLKKGIKKG